MTSLFKEKFVHKKDNTGTSFDRLQFPFINIGQKRDLHPELFPLHSPLLRESLLVSFPPLNYMLKSSGSSYLIRGPKLNSFFTIKIIRLFLLFLCFFVVYMFVSFFFFKKEKYCKFYFIIIPDF
jgi:hypothetical protein